MEIGMIGLGRMGGNMAQRLLMAGHQVHAFDQNAAALDSSVTLGASGAKSVADLVSRLASPRAVWLMLPAGDVTESCMNDLAELLSDGDAIIDGGNANYRETLRRGEMLSQRGIHLLDAGTSGGIWGLTEGVFPDGGRG